MAFASAAPSTLPVGDILTAATHLARYTSAAPKMTRSDYEGGDRRDIDSVRKTLTTRIMPVAVSMTALGFIPQ